LISVKSNESSSLKSINTTAWKRLTPTSYLPLWKRAERVTVASCHLHESWRFLCWVLYQPEKASMEDWSWGGRVKFQPSLRRG
jgi:hypothetical protein